MADKQALILVVDDDGLLRNTTQMMLRTADYLVEAAENGKVGLEKALKLHPDIILLDYQMPEMTGIEMLTKLREDEWGQDAKVLFMTNTFEVEALNVLMRLGVNDYFMKSEMSLQRIQQEVEKRLAKA